MCKICKLNLAVAVNIINAYTCFSSSSTSRNLFNYNNHNMGM
jgi:hypothetical protein